MTKIIGADNKEEKYVIRTFKLNDGTELVGDCLRGEEDGQKGYFMKKPIAFMPAQNQQGQIIPMPMEFMLTVDLDTIEFFLADSKFMVSSDTLKPEIRRAYIQITTGLDTSSGANLSEAEAMARLREQVNRAARGDA